MTDEQVLVVPTEAFRELGYFEGLCRDVARYESMFRLGRFMPRAQAEEDPTFKQLIPYVVLRHRGRIFHYRRGSKGTEARLHALRSVGVGGHINPVDGHDFDGIYRAAMLRELREEVELPPGSPRLEPLGLINDDSVPVGRVHLGVVHLLELASAEVQSREAALADSGFAEVEALHAERDEFETWSRFVLDELAARSSEKQVVA
jgi:predicted NUDIX family phosphoesterase